MLLLAYTALFFLNPRQITQCFFSFKEIAHFDESNACSDGYCSLLLKARPVKGTVHAHSLSYAPISHIDWQKTKTR